MKRKNSGGRKEQDTFERLSLKDIPKRIPESDKVVYSDEDIVLISDIRSVGKLPAKLFKLDFTLIIGIMKGSLTAMINDEHVIMGSNDAVCCSINTPICNYNVSDDFDAKILCLSPKVLNSFMRTNKILSENYLYVNKYFKFKISEDAARLFELYYQLVEFRASMSQRLYHREVANILAHAALYDLMAEVLQNYERKRVPEIGRNEEIFNQFMRLLMENNYRKRSVEYYADKMNMSAKHLSLSVKKCSGRTAFEWINQYLMDEVLRQLQYTDRSVKEIAFNMDFPNISFFGKYFKSHTGVSPTEYRKRLG